MSANEVVDMKDVPARWSEIVALTEAGAEVIVTDDSIPRIRMIPVATNKARVLGLHPGAIQTRDDFDSELPEEFWTGAS